MIDLSMTPWIVPHDVNLKDKTEGVRQHVAYMLSKTQRMFRWSGPVFSVLPPYIMEQIAQGDGKTFITDQNSLHRPVALCGTVGGEKDVYYFGKLFTSGNPVLTNPGQYDMADGVLLRNDHLMLGLSPIFERYGTQLVENEISITMASILTRAQFMISAESDRDRAAADLFIKKIIAGDLSAVLEHKFQSGITIQPAVQAASQQLTQLIELQQYLKASELNEIGVNANYNMKREALSQTESQMGDNALLPLVDEMMACRQEFCEQWNESRYGAEYGRISVEYDSAWCVEQAEIATVSEPEQEVDDNGTD